MLFLNKVIKFLYFSSLISCNINAISNHTVRLIHLIFFFHQDLRIANEAILSRQITMLSYSPSFPSCFLSPKWKSLLKLFLLRFVICCVQMRLLPSISWACWQSRVILYHFFTWSRRTVFFSFSLTFRLKNLFKLFPTYVSCCFNYLFLSLSK